MTATSATQADEQARRREAVAVSGWGAPFRFVQPRNLCFWLYLLLVGAGIRQLIEIVTPTAGVFAAADIASLVTSGLFALAFLAFLHHADRFERTPAGLATAAFLAGGVGAAFVIALPGNAAVTSLYAKLFGQPFAVDWQAALAAPFVEETAKGAVFLLVMGLAPVVVRTAYDGLIVGAYTGLGFQVFEDMLYGQNSAAQHFGADQVESVVGTFALRTVTGVVSHALFTALFAAGLVYLIGTVAQPRRVGRGLALVLAAVLVHGVWDGAAALGRGGPLIVVVMLLTTVAGIVALLVALRLGAGREARFMRAVMGPEVTAGTITAEELDGLAGRRRDRKAAVRHRPDGVTRRTEKRVLAAALDLAHDLAEAGGDDSDAVRHSRTEIARLRGQGPP
ncbi:PrsW family intramembrane metalloprotease [Pseudonocardia broussonetiae]|uniref:PrsW family intramembrane metalloprotease n=1 Tax=Pseudonocardia broussonetiae TaxID=2736640 RepID=A0A6M6JQ24_9PSEU|nr:PrsW family intramembrane metalloprotease [Pseudonocardia broussonetiae]QJY49350.1 PrsW family intramembrane metalloprotease [Pseudonocardia broussonetiae]